MAETAVFDHYEVLRRDDGSLHELGRGAMGITYKAFDTNLRCHVALKVINAASIDSDVARQRFVREARAAAQLRHRHVASVFHLGVEGDTYFYAMEFIDGETVEGLIRRSGALDPVLALRIAVQVARALGAAQKHQLVHRDIKPSNLMLVHEDEELVVKVIDFGLAKSSRKEDGESETALSVSGFVGTPHFASPEQLEENEIDVRSDIYSLGVTLWYMLAGRAPFAGSLAQVMSHHLHTEPPLGQLKNFPTSLQTLLRRMLEKDPARRQQTPLELRAEMESCIEFLAANPSGRAPAAAGEVELHPAAGEANEQNVVRKIFRLGAVIAGRYEVLESLGEGNAGWSFRARDREKLRDVRLMALHAEWAENGDALTQIEREVEKIQIVEHPNLARVFSIERIESVSFLVLENTRGFSLLEVLRARRELDAEEVLPIFSQAAAGLDAAISRGLRRVDLALHQVAIDFSQNGREAAPLLDRRVTLWPEFVVKLNALGITRELALSDTWAGGQTIVGSMGPAEREPAETGIAGKYVQSLAVIIYELLGGTLSPVMLAGAGAQPPPRYVPLATLPEEGNEVLKQALDPARSFSSATEFYQTLQKHVARDSVGTRHEATVAPRENPAPARMNTQFSRIAPAASVRESSWKKTSVRAGAVIAAAVIAGALFALLLHRPAAVETRVGNRANLSPAPSPEPFATAAPQPTATLGLNTITLPPLGAKPSPEADLPAVMRVRLGDAEAFESNRDWPRCLAAYAAIGRDFPEVETGRVRLEMVLTSLRTVLDKMSDDDFSAYKEPILQAAKLDVVAAQMILANRLRKSAPTDAFNWFCAAAARGNTPALTQVGLMYSNGFGVGRDFDKAAAWFQQASDRGDTAGKACLAECFLYGMGERKDERHAVEILQEAASAGDPRAMNLLGICLQKGIGTLRNEEEAFRLFAQAHELGFGDATGNLGVLYIRGEGVRQDVGKAVNLFQKGARDGNAACMYFLAQCLESGTGTDANQLAAETWYKKSAAAGNALAADWCRRNGIALPPAK